MPPPTPVFTEEAAAHLSTANGLIPVRRQPADTHSQRQHSHRTLLRSLLHWHVAQIVSSLTLSTCLTRLWVLAEPLLRGTAQMKPVDKISIALLPLAITLSAYSAAYSLLARDYAETALAVVSAQDKAAHDDESAAPSAAARAAAPRRVRTVRVRQALRVNSVNRYTLHTYI